MQPILYDFGFYKLHTYGVMLAFGFLAALFFCRFEARRINAHPNVMSDLLVWAIGGGILGARVLYMAIHPEEFTGILSFFAIWKGGLVYYGGFIGGCLGAYIFARRNKIHYLDLCDLGTPALMLGQGIGRWGCLMAGCCYGREVDAEFPLGIAFPAKTDSLIPVELQNIDMDQATHWLHPSQLYMAFNGLLLWIVLWIFLRRRKHRGLVTGLFLILYAASRSIIENFRGDVGERVFFGPLSTSQWVSVPVLLIGVALLLTCRSRPVPYEVGAAKSTDDKKKDED